MSVGAVSSNAQQWALIKEMRQARAAGAAHSFDTSQTGGSGQAGATGSGKSSIGTSALSGDLMASLLQIQSAGSQDGSSSAGAGADLSGLSGPGGFPPPPPGPPPGDASASSADGSANTADAGQTASSAGSGPVHGRRHHHAPPPPDDGTSSTTAASAASGDAAGDSGSGLGALLANLTKAAATYATGGLAGVAASTLLPGLKV